MVSAYLDSLNALNAKATAEYAKKEHTGIEAARERLTPLEDRLARVLAMIPAQLQREGLSLPRLQTLLRGRWRGCCHPGELGAALRKLGFVRERRWNAEKGFRALWYCID